MRSFKRVLGMVFAVAMMMTCLSFAVSADTSVVESGAVADKYSYNLYSDGLLEVISETDTADLDSISKTTLEKATSLSAEYSGSNEEVLFTVSCSRSYCNIDDFKFKFADGITVYNIAIQGFPKYTGAAGSIILPGNCEICGVEMKDSYVTSMDYLTGLVIEDFALDNCDQIGSVAVSGNFDSCYITGCDKLTKVDLRGCPKMTDCKVNKNNELTECYFPESLKTIRYASCIGNPKLTGVKIPDSVIQIQDYAFANSGLKSVSIPDGVLMIGYYAFAGTSLETVNIPVTVTRIDAKAFLGCSVKTVNFGGTRAQFENIWISNGSSDSGSINDVFGNAEIRFNENRRSCWVQGGSEDMWFYLDNAGLMVSGWKSVNGSWYLFDENYGIMLQDWQKSDNAWYYLGEDGAMKTGWQLIEDDWHYFGSDGAMRLGWQSIGGKWYYLDSANGSMKTGWQQIDGVWYYFESSGAMFTGWKQSGSDWYFLKSDGSMAANEYCQGYWLGSNGKWTYQYKATWRKDSKGWWYGDSTGWYAKNESFKIDGKVYYFDADGYCTNP